MTITPVPLQPGVELTNSFQTLATGPAVGYALLKRTVFAALAANAGPVTLTVCRVLSGGSPASTNRVIDAMVLSAGQTYVAAELADMVLSPGDTVQATCSSNTSVNAFCSGFTGP